MKNYNRRAFAYYTESDIERILQAQPFMSSFRV